MDDHNNNYPGTIHMVTMIILSFPKFCLIYLDNLVFAPSLVLLQKKPPHTGLPMLLPFHWGIVTHIGLMLCLLLCVVEVPHECHLKTLNKGELWISKLGAWVDAPLA